MADTREIIFEKVRKPFKVGDIEIPSSQLSISVDDRADGTNKHRFLITDYCDGKVTACSLPDEAVVAMFERLNGKADA